MSDKTLSPKARYKDANKRKPTIFVSIHHNASHFPWKKGATVLYASLHHERASRSLAKFVNDNVVKQAGFKNRGLEKSTNLIVLKHTKMPAILTETGYMSNAGDLDCILDKQNDIANGIVKGIKAYFMR